MKYVFKLLIILSLVAFGYSAYAQPKPVIIDHYSADLNNILENEWVNTAKQNLYIGYGHTSHGSQLMSGMSALMSYYSDGRFNWSRNQVSGSIRIVEGGTLSQDVGYKGWDDKTRTYLNATPQCNVIIWSWCGQVSSVDLDEHYLNRMAKLEEDYPNVKFVYMTGHLEGQGPSGKLEAANNKIRNFCYENNKILFDFADIEKYSPDGDINYDELFANDECNYRKPGGGTGNWANEWLQANPSHILTQIAAKCGSCAHSVSLNCVRKGIASWHLWARLAGWDGGTVDVCENNTQSDLFTISPNPVHNSSVKISLNNQTVGMIKLTNLQGEVLKTIDITNEKQIIINSDEYNKGIYFITLITGTNSVTKKLVLF